MYLKEIQLRFCNYILAVNKSTCSNILYGELGVTHLDIHIKARKIAHWAMLVNEYQSNIAHVLLFIV